MSKNGVDAFLDAGMRGFIVNTARKNFWRVAGWYDFADLVQDGYLCYYKCRERYKDVTEKPHFMSLVRTTYLNHISTLAAKQRAVPERCFTDCARQSSDATEEFSPDDVLPPQPELGTLAALIASAPAEIKELIQLLANDGLNTLKFERHRKHRRSLRETNNEFYCRLLGKDSREDIAGLIKGYFA